MKKQEIDNLYNELKEWLIGVFEEDPIPHEITTLYFFYGKINGGIYIRFLGTELDRQELSDFTYNPLEAQFFYSSLFFKIFQNKSVKELGSFIKQSIKELSKNTQLSFFNNISLKVKECNYYI